MIGVMSDSHDNVTMIRRAVFALNDAWCKLAIHASDFIARFAARELVPLGCPVKAVFANCGREKLRLKKNRQAFGKIREAEIIPL
jgi:hypothetical protein